MEEDKDEALDNIQDMCRQDVYCVITGKSNKAFICIVS